MEGIPESLKDIPKLGHLPKNVCSSNVQYEQGGCLGLTTAKSPL